MYVLERRGGWPGNVMRETSYRSPLIRFMAAELAVAKSMSMRRSRRNRPGCGNDISPS